MGNVHCFVVRIANVFGANLGWFMSGVRMRFRTAHFCREKERRERRFIVTRARFAIRGFLAKTLQCCGNPDARPP
jgi:hypothetical protein